MEGELAPDAPFKMDVNRDESMVLVHITVGKKTLLKGQILTIPNVMQLSSFCIDAF